MGTLRLLPDYPHLPHHRNHGLHLRRQLPRTPTSLALPEILLRHRTGRVHETDVEIPHPPDGQDRGARGPTDQRPRGGAEHDDAGERPTAAAAREHQAVTRHGDVPGQTTCDESAGAGTEYAITDHDGAETEPGGEERLVIRTSAFSISSLHCTFLASIIGAAQPR